MALSTLLIAVALQNTADHAQAEVQRDIVVIGSKLNKGRARVKKSRKGKIQCRIEVSTGDREIDAIGCAAMTYCYSQLEPRLVASVEKKRPAAERTALNTVVYRDYSQCVVAQRDQFIADLADRRFQARQGPDNAKN